MRKFLSTFSSWAKRYGGIDFSRFWAKENYEYDIEIDSMDKEPVRKYLLDSDWDKESRPDPLPQHVVEETTRRYLDIYQRLTGSSL